MFKKLYGIWTRWKISRNIRKNGSIEMPPELVPLTQAASVLIAFAHFKRKDFAEFNISVHFKELEEICANPGSIAIPPVITQLMLRIGKEPHMAAAETFAALVAAGDAQVDEWEDFARFASSFENPNKIALKV